MRGINVNIYEPIYTPLILKGRHSGDTAVEAVKLGACRRDNLVLAFFENV
jgi:ActR/RegA family two-component response regulator